MCMWKSNGYSSLAINSKTGTHEQEFSIKNKIQLIHLLRSTLAIFKLESSS